MLGQQLVLLWSLKGTSVSPFLAALPLTGSLQDLFLNDLESGFALESPVGGAACAVLLPPAKSRSLFCPQTSASLAPKSLVAQDC